jgi:hypothetical protein
LVPSLKQKGHRIFHVSICVLLFLVPGWKLTYIISPICTSVQIFFLQNGSKDSLKFVRKCRYNKGSHVTLPHFFINICTKAKITIFGTKNANFWTLKNLETALVWTIFLIVFFKIHLLFPTVHNFIPFVGMAKIDAQSCILAHFICVFGSLLKTEGHIKSILSVIVCYSLFVH